MSEFRHELPGQLLVFAWLINTYVNIYIYIYNIPFQSVAEDTWAL